MSFRPLWLDETGLQQLFAAVREAGGALRVVGGAVRDHLMGRRGGDVDAASTLLPEQMMELAAAQGWRAIPTGLAHGTVTLLLPERTLEVTTLRRDVSTDGRRASVAFTTDFEEDAARRDFTVNAMSMDAAGQLYDYFGGAEDCDAARIRFIGDAGQRIAEDGLRILRFFRFLATHGQPPADHDAIRACTAQKAMLEQLSGERIQQEMKKLLAAADPAYVLSQMSLMALGEVLCGQPWQLHMLHPLLQREAQHKQAAYAWLRLLVLVPEAARMQAAQHVCSRWRLSRADTQLLEFLTAPPSLNDDAAVKEALRHFSREWVLQSLLLQLLDQPALPYAKLLPIARSFDPPHFPVGAKDLLARGMQQGPELGALLRSMEARWVESGYRLSREQLLA